MLPLMKSLSPKTPAPGVGSTWIYRMKQNANKYSDMYVKMATYEWFTCRYKQLVSGLAWASHLAWAGKSFRRNVALTEVEICGCRLGLECENLCRVVELWSISNRHAGCVQIGGEKSDIGLVASCRCRCLHGLTLEAKLQVSIRVL